MKSQNVSVGGVKVAQKMGLKGLVGLSSNQAKELVNIVSSHLLKSRNLRVKEEVVFLRLDKRHVHPLI